MYHIAIASLLSGKYEIFSGASADEAFSKAYESLGGGQVAADASVEDSDAVGYVVRFREFQPNEFWILMVGNTLAGRDNDDFFFGDNLSVVVKQTEEFLKGTADE